MPRAMMTATPAPSCSRGRSRSSCVPSLGRPARLTSATRARSSPAQSGYVYNLEQIELSEYSIFASRVLWGEAVDGTAREVLAEAESDGERSPERTPRGSCGAERRPCGRE